MIIASITKWSYTHNNIKAKESSINIFIENYRWLFSKRKINDKNSNYEFKDNAVNMKRTHNDLMRERKGIFKMQDKWNWHDEDNRSKFNNFQWIAID